MKSCIVERMFLLVKKTLYLFGLSLVHLVSTLAIALAFLPIANWYINFRPIWGVDFFLVATLSQVLNLHFVAPFSFWIYSWFGGWPIFLYPILHSYGVSLLSRHFDLVYSVQLWTTGSTLLFGVGAYFLFYVISKNPFLSLVLAVATLYSGGVYQTATWAGSIPSYATQAAFPWALAFLVLFLQSKNRRYLLFSTLIAGISIWGHPLVFIVYILPAFAILVFCKFDEGLLIIKKFKTIFILTLIPFIIALPTFYSTFTQAVKNAIQSGYQGALSTTSVNPAEVDIGAKMFNQLQPARMYTDNHMVPFLLAGVLGGFFFLSFLLGRRFGSVLRVLPYATLAAYFAFYIWIFGQGISIYHGGWYRLFWSVPIWIGALASIFWKEMISNLFSVVKNGVLRVVLWTGCTVGIVLIGAIFLYVYPYRLTINNIIYRSQASSAHPDILNVAVSNNERGDLKKKLVPSWINGDDTNFRLYDGDQTVNLWWNSMFKMPLARGYLDPPLQVQERGYVFWLDAALSESLGEPQLVEAFKYPLDTAISNALFLVDWNAIAYYEGGHTGSSFTPVPKYLIELLVDKNEILDLNERKYTKKDVTLNFSKFKDELTSPILSSTNATIIGIFATDIGYETVIRSLAEKDNLNSQKIIPIKLGRYADKYSLSDLKNFDMLYLYDYDYRKGDRVFKTLTEYVRSGKKVFVETGVEVKESNKSLPEFFPVKAVERKGMGREWELESGQSDLTRDVNLSKFDPPIFDDTEWKMSSAKNDDIRAGAQVILKNKGRVVMARQAIGSGEVFWSGLNFAYHLSRNHNLDEAKFFINILSSMADLSVKPKVDSKVDFVNVNARAITSTGGRGVLFKEQAYEGWEARAGSGPGDIRKVKIYKAGPAFPGYMYVPFAEGDKFVSFEFGGSLRDKVLIYLSGLIIIVIFDEVALGGLILGRLRRFISFRTSLKVGRWWSKEDEE